MSSSLFALIFFTAVACGIVGGAFFAFSTFVMKGLGRVPAAQGIVSMQSINVEAIRARFMAALLGAALACIAVAGVSLASWDESFAPYSLVGSVLYLVGTILPTRAANVPRNDLLAELDPATTQAASYWLRYLTSWTAWNHVRTAGALAASACLIWSIHVG
jgi:uncharacterized membrane protein